MACDVFISHSAKDKRVADAVVARLEAESVTCWVAPRDVVPGARWGESIINAIESSRIMILIFSKSANESPQIEREVERAVNKEVYIIPFRIDDITPSKNLEYFISNSQWIDAYSPPLERHLGNLAKTIKAVLANPPLPEPVDINAPVNEPAKRKSHLNFDAFTPVGRTGPVADGSTAHISSRLRMAIIARSHFRAVAECYLHQQYRERNNIAVFNNVVSNFDRDYNTLSAHSSRSIRRLNIERQANVDLSAAAKSTALTKYKETN